MAPTCSTVLARLGTTFERTASVRGDDDLQEVLEDVARAISEVLGYRAVVINVYRYAYDDMLTATAVGVGRVAAAAARHDLAAATPGRRCSTTASAGARAPTSSPTASSTGTRSAWTPTCPTSSRATTRMPGCPATLCSCRCATGAISCSA